MIQILLIPDHPTVARINEKTLLVQFVTPFNFWIEFLERILHIDFGLGP